MQMSTKSKFSAPKHGIFLILHQMRQSIALKRVWKLNRKIITSLTSTDKERKFQEIQQQLQQKQVWFIQKLYSKFEGTCILLQPERRDQPLHEDVRREIFKRGKSTLEPSPRPTPLQSRPVSSSRIRQWKDLAKNWRKKHQWLESISRFEHWRYCNKSSTIRNKHSLKLLG